MKSGQNISFFLIDTKMYGTVKRKHFSCVDVHCGGEPARILISGYPSNIPGRN